MRSIKLVPLVFAVVVASCSGGSSSDGALPTPTTGAPSSAPATEPPIDSVVDEERPVAEAPARSYAELADRVADGLESKLTLALSEFAALYDVQLPGAVPLLADDSLPQLGTDVVFQLGVLDAELTDEQRSIVTARLDEVDAASVEVYHSLDDPQYLAVVEESAEVGVVEAEGFRASAGLRSPEPSSMSSPPSDRLEEVRRVAIDAIAAIQRRLGGVALDVYYRVGPLPVLGQTDFIDLFEACIVTIDEDSEGLTGDVLRSIVAHETFHCWHAINQPTSYAAAERFFLEGMATWVGEEFADGTNFGGNWWLDYVAPSTARLGRMDYEAYGFWLQVEQIRGADAMWALIPGLAAVADDAVALWDKAFAGIGVEAQAGLAALTVRRPDWSPAWDVSLGQPAAGRSVGERVVTPGASATHRIDRAAQSVVTFTFDGLSGDTSYVLTEEIGGLATARFDGGGADDDVITAAITTEWCLSGSCECPDGVVPIPGLRFVPAGSMSRTVALTTSFASPSNFASASISDIADRCDEEASGPPDVGTPGGGFTGLWRANPNAIETMFEQASAFGAGSGQGLDVAGVTGDLLMEFRDDGTGRLTYAGVTLFINDAGFGDLTLNGSGSFVWGIVDETVRISGTDYEIGVSSSALGDLVTITDEDLPAGGLTVLSGAVAGDMMTISAADGSAGEVFFPILWTRA